MMLGASVAEFDFGAHRCEKPAGGFDVAYLRNVFENHRFIGQQGCRHARERGVLRATNSNRPQQGIAAADY
jgi:hypothetical protein